jgi:hypothetical protein
MLQWAASSIEGSLNQSAMPHAIILLNFTDPNIDPSGWTIKSATNSLLKEHAQAVVDNPSVRSRAQYWEQKGKHIATTKDLLECYYSSVSVVRVPLKGLWGLLDQQVGELTQHIQKVCSDARDNRKRLRVNFDTEEFQAALSMGFRLRRTVLEIEPDPQRFWRKHTEIGFGYQSRSQNGWSQRS